MLDEVLRAVNGARDAEFRLKNTFVIRHWSSRRTSPIGTSRSRSLSCVRVGDCAMVVGQSRDTTSSIAHDPGRPTEGYRPLVPILVGVMQIYFVPVLLRPRPA